MLSPRDPHPGLPRRAPRFSERQLPKRVSIRRALMLHWPQDRDCLPIVQGHL